MRAMDVAGRIRDPSFLPPILDFLLSGEPAYDPFNKAGRVVAKFGAAAIEPLLARDSFTVRDRVDRALDRIFNWMHESELPPLAKHPVEKVRERALSRLARLAKQPG